jgi:hypothetical protein
LDIEIDLDYSLIGVSCYSKDYRLCWEINKEMNFHLVRKTNPNVKGLIQCEDGQEILNSGLNVYTHENKNKGITYRLVGNKTTKGFLIPEHKQVDYFVCIRGISHELEEVRMIKSLRNIGIVLTAFSIVPASIKSKNKLILTD